MSTRMIQFTVIRYIHELKPHELIKVGAECHRDLEAMFFYDFVEEDEAVVAVNFDVGHETAAKMLEAVSNDEHLKDGNVYEIDGKVYQFRV